MPRGSKKTKDEQSPCDAKRNMTTIFKDKEGARWTDDQIEEREVPALGSDYPGKGSALERRLIRRIDLRLVPACAFMYACSLIDRTNLPNARVSGMDRDLGFQIGNRYTLAVMMFFIPYILFEIPSNLVLKAGVHPRLWLPTATLIFGVVMVCHGFAPNWYTLVGLRVPLGTFEAVLFPGCIFLISSWYPRYALQKRISAFYLTGASFSGFSNIIAYGFSEMDGLSGRPGWAWIFFMMGILTILSALIAYVLVPNFPSKASFLTPEEKQLVHDRINADRHDADDEAMTTSAVFKNLGNIRIWAMGLLFLCSTLPAYAFAYFLPLILRGFGYSVRDSQLLSAPPYIASVILGMIVAFIADRIHMRGPFIIGGAIVSAVGQIILAYTTAPGVRYFGSFLAVMGCQSNIPTVMTWSQNNLRGAVARSVSSAIIVGSGGIGGIIASVSFKSSEAARSYPSGIWTCFAAQMTILVVTGSLMFWYSIQNRQAREHGKVLERQPGFHYTL